MKCTKAHKWIALYREGELEAGIQERLSEHLAACESCRQLYRSYKANDRMAAQIRSQSPVCIDEDIITNRIMNTLADMKKRPAETGFSVFADRIIGLAMLPAVRRIAIACILIIAAAFAYQQVYIQSNTVRLEKQLSVAGKAGLVNAASKDMQECLKKSARYLSSVKTGRMEIEKQLNGKIDEDPEAIMRYASFICSHKYNYLESTFSPDAIVIPEYIMSRALENYRK